MSSSALTFSIILDILTTTMKWQGKLKARKKIKPYLDRWNNYISRKSQRVSKKNLKIMSKSSKFVGDKIIYMSTVFLYTSNVQLECEDFLKIKHLPLYPI